MSPAEPMTGDGASLTRGGDLIARPSGDGMGRSYLSSPSLPWLPNHPVHPSPPNRLGLAGILAQEGLSLLLSPWHEAATHPLLSPAQPPPGPACL